MKTLLLWRALLGACSYFHILPPLFQGPGMVHWAATGQDDDDDDGPPPVPTEGADNTIDLAQIAMHSTPDDCWVWTTHDGKVYSMGAAFWAELRRKKPAVAGSYIQKMQHICGQKIPGCAAFAYAFALFQSGKSVKTLGRVPQEQRKTKHATGKDSHPSCTSNASKTKKKAHVKPQPSASVSVSGGTGCNGATYVEQDLSGFSWRNVDVTTYEGSSDFEKDQSCCAKCQVDSECEYWVRATDSDACWLKSNLGDPVTRVTNSLRRGGVLRNAGKASEAGGGASASADAPNSKYYAGKTGQVCVFEEEVIKTKKECAAALTFLGISFNKGEWNDVHNLFMPGGCAQKKGQKTPIFNKWALVTGRDKLQAEPQGGVEVGVRPICKRFKKKPWIPMSEVKKHNTANDCWVWQTGPGQHNGGVYHIHPEIRKVPQHLPGAPNQGIPNLWGKVFSWCGKEFPWQHNFDLAKQTIQHDFTITTSIPKAQNPQTYITRVGAVAPKHRGQSRWKHREAGSFLR